MECTVASPAPAAQQVFDTTELLEMILLEVDTKTLLVAGQRTSKRFKEVIDRSPKIQRALFFKQAPNDGLQYGIRGVNPYFVFEHDKFENTFYGNFGYCMKYNEWYRELRKSLRWNFSLDEPLPQDTPGVTPSWKRMYLAHENYGGMDFRVMTKVGRKRLHCNVPTELPEEPAVMGEYAKVALEAFIKLKESRERSAREESQNQAAVRG